MQKPQVLAVIPARGGSKGISKKNIRPFSGKLLLVHSIDAAKASPSVSRVIVSTDSEEIAAIAKEGGAEVPFLRPAEFAGDKSNVADAVIHLLAELKSREGYEPDYVLLLQPTNPLRNAEDVEKSIELIQKRDGDSLVSIYATSEPLLITKDAKDTLTLINNDLFTSTNRQLMPTYYRLDGCMIFLVKVKKFLETRSFFGGKIIGYQIERWRVVDIDEPQDFVLGELIHANREKIAGNIKRFS